MPNALTLHDIPDDLYDALRADAARVGTSMNKAAKALLASALGLLTPRHPNHDSELAPFFGGLDTELWSRAKECVAASRRVEPEDWS